MIKKALLGISILSVFMACGGSDSDSPTETISKKEKVVIMFNALERVCKSKELLREFQVQSGVKSVYITVAPNNTTCAVFGKNESNCGYLNMEDSSSLSCVAGWNVDSTNNINNKPSPEDELIFRDKIMEKVIILGE